MPENDGVSMDSATTADVMRILGAAATGFRQAWDSAKPSLSAAENALGNGPLGTAFMAGYRPGMPGTVKLIETSGRILEHAAGAGTASIHDYLGADTKAADAFPGRA